MKWRAFTITLRHPDGSIYCRVSRFGIRSAVKRLRELAADYLNIYGRKPVTAIERNKP